MKAKDMEFDPVDYYRLSLKDDFRKNASDFFEGLVKKSGIDEGKNASTADALYKAQAEDKANEKSLNTCKSLQAVLIFLGAVGIIAAVIGILLLATGNGALAGGLLLGIGLVFALAMFLIVFLVLRPRQKKMAEKDIENNKKVAKLKAECLAQIYPIHCLMSDKDYIDIVHRTTDAFHFDVSLDPEKLHMFKSLYDFNQGPTDNESVFTCQSGDVSTNPFIRFRLFTMKIQDKVYVGTKVIHWTEVVGSGKNRHVVSHTQTLRATLAKPAPFYNYATFVVYGNQAAPNLSFHRMPSGLSLNHDDKEVEKLVKERTKAMERKAEEVIAKGGSFQPLANSDFESLFGAFDRDNEVEYRLLFTPLAQQNMAELITSKEPYGDDFSFFKMKKINIVSSRHGREIPDFTKDLFIGQVDIRVFRKEYVEMMCRIFASFYFEIAPILAIPLYQQTDAGKFDPVAEKRKVSDYEAESFVNHMQGTEFVHPESATPQILKARYLETVGESDVFSIRSSSFKAIPMVDYVAVPGGDGRTHSVAVQWYQYVPLERVSSIAMRRYDGNDSQFRSLMDEKQYFEQEKAFYRTAVKNKNFVGFRLQDGYNYSQTEDSRVGKILQGNPGKRD